MVAPLIFSIGGEVVTNANAVRTFFIYPEYLLVLVNAPVWLIVCVYLFYELFIFMYMFICPTNLNYCCRRFDQENICHPKLSHLLNLVLLEDFR